MFTQDINFDEKWIKTPKGSIFRLSFFNIFWISPAPDIGSTIRGEDITGKEWCLGEFQNTEDAKKYLEEFFISL